MVTVPAAKASRDTTSVLHAGSSHRLVAVLGGTTTARELQVALRQLATPRSLVRGPDIAKYERAFAQRVGVGHGVSFSAGRVGLYGLLLGLGVGPGDEVLLQVPTHIVVPNAVRYTGARPVYVDCRLDSFNMDMEHAESLITPRTKAIVLQHTFGNPGDIDGALALARRHDLALIEDCVHALGATYDGRQAGSLGRAAFFSTEETKTISSTMGGMVVTYDPELAARLRTFQSGCRWPSALLVARYVSKLVLYHLLTQPKFHRYPRTVYELVGRRSPLPQAVTAEEVRGERPANYKQRLANAQAALAMSQLRNLEANLAHRRTVAGIYADVLSRAGIETVKVLPKASPAFVRFPVWVEDRAAALRAAAPYALLGTWFTSVLEEAASPTSAGYRVGSCPNAEATAAHLVNLPTHLRVTEQDAENIAWAIARTHAARQSHFSGSQTLHRAAVADTE